MSGSKARRDLGEKILDADGNEVDPEAERHWIQRIFSSTFIVLHDMCRDTNISYALLVAFWVLDLLFMLLLPLGPGKAQPWGDTHPPSIVAGIWSFLGPLWITPGAGSQISTVHVDWLALFAILAAWMGLTVVIVGWLLLSHAGLVTAYTPSWMTMYLRASGRVATHALWFPIMLNLVSPFNCKMGAGQHWYDTEITCWSGKHIGMVVGSCVILPLALAWHVLIAMSFINREPDFTGKKNLLAAPHGRVQAAMLVLKTILAAFYVFAESELNVWVFELIVLAGGLAWAWMYLSFLPYHLRALNGMQVAAAAAFSSACVCGLVAAGLGDGGHGSHTGAIAWLLLLPGMIFSGWALVAARTRSMASGTNAANHELELSSPYLVDLRVRCMIAEAIASGHDPRVTHKSQDSSNSKGADGMSASKGGNGYGGLTSADDSAAQRHAIDMAMADAEAEAIRTDANHVWYEANRAFNNSAMLSLFWAGYQATVARNAHLERLRLRDAAAKADWSAVDVQFFCYSRLKDIEEAESKSGRSKMDVDRRMKFEKLQGTSRIAVANARGSVLSFWAELASKHPDLQKLKVLGLQINVCLSTADGTFRDLLELAPQNATIMRMYADFLLELANDPRKAQELLTDAEQIEEDASKVHLNAINSNIVTGMPCGEFDLSADSVALIRVSSESDRLGAIYDVNGHACKLFGYSRRELLSRTLSDLVPPPIGPIHNMIIQRFLETGNVRMIGANRTTFIQHRAGYMLAAKINIRPSLEGFAAVLDLLPTPPGEMYCWCLGAQAGWRISAMCEASMGALNVDVPSLKGGSVTLSRFVADVEAMINGAVEATTGGSDNGHTVTFTNISSWSGQAAGALTLKATSSAWKDMGAASNDDDDNSMSLNVKCDVLHIAALGVPLYMLRLKRAGAARGAIGAAKAKAAAKAGMDDSDEEGDAASDAPVGERNEHAEDAGLPSNPIPSARGPAMPARHPGVPAGADMSSCPVMSVGARAGKPTANAGAGTGVQSQGSRVVVRSPQAASGPVALPGAVDTVSPERHAASAHPSGEATSGSAMFGTVTAPTASERGEGSTILEIAANPANTSGENSKGNSVNYEETERTMSQAHRVATGEDVSPGHSTSAGLGLTRGMSSRVAPAPSSSGRVHSEANSAGGGASTAEPSIASGPSNAGRLGRALSFRPPPGTVSHSTSDRVNTVGADEDRNSAFSGGPGTFQPSLHRVASKSILKGKPGGSDAGGSAVHEKIAAMRANMGLNIYVPGDRRDSKPGVPRQDGVDNGSVLKGHSGKSAFGGQSAHGPAGTVHSGGSGTSATSITEILRRGVMARTGRLEMSLRLTRMAVLIAFFVTATLNLVSMLVTQQLLFQMYDNLSLVYKNGQRAVLSQRMYAAVQAWAMAQAGLAEPVDMSVQAPRISSFVDQFETLHQNLYLSVDGSLAEEKSLYTSGSAVTVYDLIPGQPDSLELNRFNTISRTLNLGNAGIEFMARMRRVLQMNAADIRYNDVDVFWIVSNGGNSIREGLNRSMMLADLRSEFQGGKMKQADIIILIVSEVVFLIIMGCVMLPAVLKVVQAHHAVFQTFIQVPLPIIRALRASVQKRINIIARAEEEAEVGIDIGGKGNEIEDEEGEDQLKALLSKGDKNGDPRKGSVTGSSHDKDSDDGSDHDHHSKGKSDEDGGTTITDALRKYASKIHVQNMLVAANGKDDKDEDEEEKDDGSGKKKKRKRKSKRAYRRAGSDMAANLIAFIWPIIAYMIYFAVIWWYKGNMVDDVVTQKASLLWQTQAEMYMNLATIRVRFAAAGCDSAYLTQQLDSASSDLAFAEYLVDAVLYGSDDRNMKSAIQTGVAGLPQLWMSNGCVPNDDWFYTAAECKAFGSGVTAKGLLGAFRSFGSYSRQLISDRRAMIGNVNCAPIRMNDQGSIAYLVNKFGSALLSVGFARASELTFNAPSAYINDFYNSYSVIVALTIIALVGFWYIFYVPLVARLDKDIKNVRLLLLLFPDEVARSVPAIVEAGRQLLLEAGSSAGSVATHSVIGK